jgi:hypothetical protein
MTRWMLLAAMLAACGDDSSTTDARPQGSGVLFINEVMPSNLMSTCKDIVGEADDWIEIYNTGDSAVDLGGFMVSDNPLFPAKGTLAAGVTVPANGYLLLWADDQVQGLDHLPFKLDADGEEIGLYAPDGGKLDSYAWPIANPDQSFARFPDGTGPFVTCATHTCGASNGNACITPREVSR